MSPMKKTLSAVAILLLAFAINCKDKGETSTTAPAPTPAPKQARFQLSGTPAGNLITVFEAGVAALEANAENPAAAAQELEAILAEVNVEDLRAIAKSAREAGQGATDVEKKALGDAMEKYKKLAATLGGKDPAAFNAAHTKWSAVWGIK